jgi:hypothetical protein
MVIGIPARVDPGTEQKVEALRRVASASSLVSLN